MPASPRWLLPILLFATLACSSGAAIPIEPEFNIRVLQVPEALPGMANPFATVVQVDVINRSSEPLTLQRIEVSSVGEGRYEFDREREQFNRVVQPGKFDSFPVRVLVYANETIGRAEEPLHIRGTVFFSTEDGAFRRTFMQRVNPSTLERAPRE